MNNRLTIRTRNGKDVEVPFELKSLVRVGRSTIVYEVISYGEDITGAVYVNLSSVRSTVPLRWRDRSIYIASGKLHPA